MRLRLALAVVLATQTTRARVDPGAEEGFPVGATTLALVDASRGRPLPTEVWYPARADGRDARARRGRFPLVLLAHGLCGSRTNYEFLSVHLARHGFVVAAPDFPGITQTDCGRGVPAGDLATDPAQDLAFLRAVLRDRAGPAATMARLVHGRRAGLVGHSLGGFVVAGAAAVEPAFAVLVALAPAVTPAMALAFADVRPRRAVLAMGGTSDTAVSLEGSTVPFFAALAPPAFLVKIAAGTHSGFTDVDGGLSAPALARQQALVRRYATAFLARYLARERRFGRVLTPEDAATQGADVTLVARTR